MCEPPASPSVSPESDSRVGILTSRLRRRSERSSGRSSVERSLGWSPEYCAAKFRLRVLVRFELILQRRSAGCRPTRARPARARTATDVPTRRFSRRPSGRTRMAVTCSPPSSDTRAATHEPIADRARLLEICPAEACIFANRPRAKRMTSSRCAAGIGAVSVRRLRRDPVRRRL